MWRAYNKGHPPPFRKRKTPFTPIIFRTKNTAKSRLGRLEKISEKICRKMFREKREAPNLVERGRGVLKYERIKLGAKIVELFGNARGEFFHFIFVP